MAPDELRRLTEAIGRARAHLASLQNPKGYWEGELEADVTVSAGYVPLMYFMTGAVDPVRKARTVKYVMAKQNPDGSWGSYYAGPGDLNVTVQTYFDLKLAGVPADDPSMLRARDFILAHGGVSKTGVFTKIWLALFGQYDWRGTPSVPPEVILLPNWFYFNIYEFASWSRETIVALTVVLTLRPVCPVPEYARIPELYVEPEGRRDYSLGKIDKPFSWRSFFLLMDSLFKLYERLPVKPGRRLALRKTEEWVVQHQEKDGSWGGIMLPWVYSLVALKALGYPLDHPVMERGMKGLEGFIMEDENSFRLLPATSPVWDTAWAAIALRESGMPADDPLLVRSARWLLEQQITAGGDWQVKNPKTEPGGWAFEFENDFYPDMDDTPVVARALRRIELPESETEHKERAIEKGANWAVSMQSRDGGWAAFDLNNDKAILAHVPFADFMAPLDPTCADVTAHVVELLGETGSHPRSMAAAISYLKRTQEADGAWYGRWGVNYLYGTALVLAALKAAGEDPAQPYIRRAVDWIVGHQNRNGGWGESCLTYEKPATRGIGPSTASQTAWAILGLVAAGEASNRSVERGIRHLLDTQQEEGGWKEECYTGTGFPRAFYLRYELYKDYFPLMALARYRACLEEEG